MRLTILSLVILILASCVPINTDPLVSSSSQVLLSCLESVVLYGWDNQALDECISRGSVILTDLVLNETKSQLLGLSEVSQAWSSDSLKSIANVLGAELPRSTDSESAIVDSILLKLSKS